MRGSDETSGSLFSYVDLEDRIPARHPLRKIRQLVNAALASLDSGFDVLYSVEGRPLIAPERLLRASLIQILLSVRSERQLMEQMEYNLMFRWFVGLGIDDPVWVPTMTPETPKDRNAEVDFRGQKRSNVTHASVADPEARPYKKSAGTGAALCFIGHTLMENRHGLIVQTEMTQADGHAERRAALAMIHRHSPGSTRRLTVGADKGYDSADFVKDMRQACVTPHVAQKARHSAIDGRTTRHAGYALSQKRRKKIEEPFGWAKTVGPMAQTMLRGVKRVGAQFAFTMAACNLARLPKLLAV
jgi:hypothetical protein